MEDLTKGIDDIKSILSEEKKCDMVCGTIYVPKSALENFSVEYFESLMFSFAKRNERTDRVNIDADSAAFGVIVRTFFNEIKHDSEDSIKIIDEFNFLHKGVEFNVRLSGYLDEHSDNCMSISPVDNDENKILTIEDVTPSLEPDVSVEQSIEDEKQKLFGDSGYSGGIDIVKLSEDIDIVSDNNNEVNQPDPNEYVDIRNINKITLTIGNTDIPEKPFLSEFSNFYFWGISVKYQKLADDVKIPDYSYDGDAGVNIYNHSFKEIYSIYNKKKDLSNQNPDEVKLEYGDRLKIGSGLRIQSELPYIGFNINIRSGISHNHGIVNTQDSSKLDANHTGEFCICVTNNSRVPYIVKKGECLVQLTPFIQTKLLFEQGDINETERGDKGFGSSDNK